MNKPNIYTSIQKTFTSLMDQDHHKNLLLETKSIKDEVLSKIKSERLNDPFTVSDEEVAKQMALEDEVEELRTAIDTSNSVADKLYKELVDLIREFLNISAPGSDNVLVSYSGETYQISIEVHSETNMNASISKVEKQNPE